MKGHLIYILQNCQTAFEELKRLNSELVFALNPNIEVDDINRIGSLHRMTQDYLIIRVAGLFDKDSRTASFQQMCPNDQDYASIKNEDIIKYLIELRHNFSAHNNLARKQNGKFPETAKILKSNLPTILQKLTEIANKY